MQRESVMSEIRYHIAVSGRELEILELLAGCFPEYWRTHAEKGVFPHRETAFLAEYEGHLVGHVGVIPFKVHTRGNRQVSLGGIASVATDPGFRGRGIAATLCAMAAEWCKAHAFVAMPLFTALFPVYEKSGWETCGTMKQAKRLVLPHPVRNKPSILRKKAPELSSGEKKQIIVFYEKQAPFPGKVLRSMKGDFHSWDRIFREPDYRFYLDGDGYALEINGVLAELCAVPEQENGLLCRILSYHRNAMDSIVPDLTPDPLLIQSVPSPLDPYHGEKPMWNWLEHENDGFCSLVRKEFHFPLADKF